MPAISATTPNNRYEKDFDVIALGGAAFDIPVSPVPRDIMAIGGVNADIRMATGGDALNGAISLSSLGMRTALLTYTGTDEFSDAIVERLKKPGSTRPSSCATKASARPWPIS